MVNNPKKWKVVTTSSMKTDVKKIVKSNLSDKYLSILNTLVKNPYLNTQSFEKLTPPIKSLYSRRLNSENRVVYKILKKEHKVKILSCWGHY